MVQSMSDFPFRSLRSEIYLTLEILMHVEHPQVLKFMFKVNKATRSFVQNNMIAIKNGFINGGLIIYSLKSDFYHY